MKSVEVIVAHELICAYEKKTIEVYPKIENKMWQQTNMKNRPPEHMRIFVA